MNSHTGCSTSAWVYTWNRDGSAALVMKNKCELITGDKEFKQVEGAIKIKWM